MGSHHRNSGDIAGALGAYETAPAIMLACEGEEMVLASANEAARHALGRECEFGRPVRDLAPAVVDQLSTALSEDVLGTVYATGRSITRTACRVEVPDEGRPPFEVFWDVTVSPWYFDDGSVRGVLAHGVDVTETTRARRREIAARRTIHEGGALHDVITLQDAMLPQWLPVLPGVEIAGRYLLAQEEQAAGGDWYDAVGLGAGRVALMVGDVVGHGVAAAAAMGQLRTIVHERLLGGDDLGQAMQALDVFARSCPDARCASVCVAVLDTSTGRLEYCTAGHPPPLVVRPEAGRSRFLTHSGGAPLATSGEMTVAVDHVDCGDLVILYTDGILSRPGRSMASTTVELGQLAVDAATGRDGSVAAGPADRVCERALELTTGRTGYTDDIAVLVAEVTEPPMPIHLDVPADDDAVRVVLDALAEWLESLRVRDLDQIVIQHAVDELVANVVDHAYPSGSEHEHDGRLTVDAELTEVGDVQIRFADTGQWVEPPLVTERGRGLTIVRGMVDRLVVHSAGSGTSATIRHRLSRPARMLTGVTTPTGHRWDDETREEPFSMIVEGSRLRLDGPLDAVHLDDVRGALAETPGSGRVVLDLSRVSRLPSAAVRALHLARESALDRDQELVFYAPAGTAAQHVLELVRLPYALTEPG